MVVHPYEMSSNTYNFFFHPLHKTKENPWKAVGAIIVNIALSIFTFCLWQVPFWIVNRLDHRKIEVWKSKDNPNKIQIASERFFEKNVTQPIEKTGRIRHGANTCYIATVIQLCRQLPSVKNVLKNGLRIKSDESEEKFAGRQLIHQHLKKIILTTEMGNEVSSKMMDEFHSILYQHSQILKVTSIPKPGNGGDAVLAYGFLLEALSIDDKHYCEDSEETIIWHENDLGPQMSHFVWDPSKVKPKLSIQIENNPSRKVNYSLAGVSCYGTGHAIAYIKDLAHPSDKFIVCDDMAPTKKAKSLKPDSTRFLAIYTRDS